MKNLFTFIFCLINFGVLFGQIKYTSSDKKAIKYYEDALIALNRNQWDEAAQLAKDAIDKDESFIEPYLILGDYSETQGDYQKGLSYYEKAVGINPDFYPTAFFKMAKFAMLLENYSYSADLIATYFEYDNRRKSLEEAALTLRKNVIFAREAIKLKVPFNPINLGKGVNSQYDEYYPALTADDAELLFTRKIPDSRVRGIGNNPGVQEDFFVSLRDTTKNVWQNATGLAGNINTEYNEGAPTITADGKTMVFTACELYGDLDYGQDRVGFGSCDLFISYKENNSWSKPQNLGKSINSAHWETQPSLSADGRVLFFIRGKRDRNRNINNMEIMFSVKSPDGTWSQAFPMPAPINTPENESSVHIHPDGQTLYFASTGHPGFGGEDLFVTRIGENGEWTEPENLGYPINTSKNENSLLVSSKGEIAYFASNRDGGNGGLDLYQFILPEKLRPVPVSFTKGFVYDIENKKPLDANFRLVDIKTGDLIVESRSDNKGEFLVTLPSNKDYALEVQKDGYLYHSENFSLKENPDAAEPRYLNIGMSPVKQGESVVLRNIFFESGKFDLKPESEVELKNLHVFLSKNPSLRIEIAGHTDNVGEEADNLLLSKNRAEAVYTYLIINGIAKERITFKGSGESQPVASNDTPEGRAANRRTVFTVL